MPFSTFVDEEATDVRDAVAHHSVLSLAPVQRDHVLRRSAALTSVAILSHPVPWGLLRDGHGGETFLEVVDRHYSWRSWIATAP